MRHIVQDAYFMRTYVRNDRVDPPAPDRLSQRSRSQLCLSLQFEPQQSHPEPWRRR